MNAEQNLPESQNAVATPPSAPSEGEGSNATEVSGANPSKSRRRRRKRKNRSASAGAQPGETPSVDGVAPEAPSQAAPAEVATQQRMQGTFVPQLNGSASANGASNGQTQGQGKRWQQKKKKFRRAGTEGQPRPEPGNSLTGSNSGGAGRRQRKGGQQSRGPRTFVGPMDHSYREVNGNYADVPASTIETQGNYGRRSNNGHHRSHGTEDRMPPELMTSFRPVAIPDDAPTHIYFFIEDLFFTAKIQESARQQGVKVAFMKADKDVVSHLADLPEHEHPSLIVFDLNNAAAKPLTMIPKLKNKLKKGTSIVGFLSHLQGDLKAKAVEAGCSAVMPRAAFSQNLPNLLRRYGVEEENEPNFNQ